MDSGSNPGHSGRTFWPLLHDALSKVHVVARLFRPLPTNSSWMLVRSFTSSGAPFGRLRPTLDRQSRRPQTKKCRHSRWMRDAPAWARREAAAHAASNPRRRRAPAAKLAWHVAVHRTIRRPRQRWRAAPGRRRANTACRPHSHHGNFACTTGQCGMARWALQLRVPAPCGQEAGGK